jgi:hypothetical protein
VSVLLLRGDAIRLPLPDRSVDLVCGSPPYTDARTYGIGSQRDPYHWVQWMMQVSEEALRTSRGAVCWIVASKSKQWTYRPAVEGLQWSWFAAGGSAFRPVYWRRVGIPGSGSRQWLRGDVEVVLVFKRHGPLPWSNPLATGHPPKWGLGGESNHRLTDGTRRNQWGAGPKTGRARRADGRREVGGRPSHTIRTRAGQDGAASVPVPVSNPGNFWEIELPEGLDEVLEIPTGGGLMGHALAHQNEAPYPEKLAERLIRTLSPPGGTVLDPFCGSGTTIAAAERLGRRGLGIDIRHGQLEISRRRLERPHAPVPKPNPKIPESYPLWGE